MLTEPRVILGVDPGSRRTGFGIIKAEGQRFQYLGSGVIKITADSLAQKCQQIFSGLMSVIADYQPTAAAIESVFCYRNVSSALKLGQARGAAIVAVGYHGLDLAEYAPRAIKQAVVGYGGAEKAQVQHMIKALLSLTECPPEDAADALAVAICHACQQRWQ